MIFKMKTKKFAIICLMGTIILAMFTEAGFSSYSGGNTISFPNPCTGHCINPISFSYTYHSALIGQGQYNSQTADYWAIILFLEFGVPANSQIAILSAHITLQLSSTYKIFTFYPLSTASSG